jgi:hypothetical protein
MINSTSAQSSRITHNRPLKKSTNRFLLPNDSSNSRPHSNSSINSFSSNDYQIMNNLSQPQQKEHQNDDSYDDDDDVIQIDDQKCDLKLNTNNKNNVSVLINDIINEAYENKTEIIEQNKKSVE